MLHVCFTIKKILKAAQYLIHLIGSYNFSVRDRYCSWKYAEEIGLMGDIVLVAARDFEKDKVDIINVYPSYQYSKIQNHYLSPNYLINMVRVK